MEDNNVKILFRFYSDILDEYTVETMWGLAVDVEKGLYLIKNIPFYVQAIATEDLVLAEYDDDEKMLTYRETMEYSDNSTVQVVVMDDTLPIETVRELFKETGCPSEKLNTKYFAMEIPGTVNYRTVRTILSDMEQKEQLSFNEACLSDKHRGEIE